MHVGACVRSHLSIYVCRRGYKISLDFIYQQPHSSPCTHPPYKSCDPPVCLHPTLSRSLAHLVCLASVTSHVPLLGERHGEGANPAAPMHCTQEESGTEGGVDSDEVAGRLESGVESSMKITRSQLHASL